MTARFPPIRLFWAACASTSARSECFRLGPTYDTTTVLCKRIRADLSMLCNPLTFRYTYDVRYLTCVFGPPTTTTPLNDPVDLFGQQPAITPAAAGDTTIGPLEIMAAPRVDFGGLQRSVFPKRSESDWRLSSIESKKVGPILSITHLEPRRLGWMLLTCGTSGMDYRSGMLTPPYDRSVARRMADQWHRERVRKRIKRLPRG